MFYEGFLNICKEKGVAPSAVLRDLNISTGAIHGWKRGGDPSNRTLKSIAEYFNITVPELEAGETKKEPHAEEGKERIARIFYELTKDFTDEQQDEVMNYIEFVRSKRKQNQ